MGPDEETRSSGRFRGRDEVRQLFEGLADTWGTAAVELEEIIEAAGGRVFVVENWHVRGRDGIEVDTKLIDVYAFRDGLIVRVDGFRDRAQALQAVGLRS